MIEYTEMLQVADSRAQVQYRLDDKGKIIVMRVTNLDQGNPITATTMAGSEFEKLASGCAAVIEDQRRV